MKRKIITLCLVAILLFNPSVFSGCKFKTGKDQDIVAEESSDTTSGTEDNIPDIKKALFDGSAELDAEFLSTAVILYDKTNAAKNVSELILTLRSHIQEYFGVRLSVKDIDSESNVSSKILIGDTGADASDVFYSEIKNRDYGYGIINGSLVIAGGSADLTQEALESFIFFIQNSGFQNDTFFSNSNAFLSAGEYKLDLLTLNGTDISKYRIVYPAADNGYEYNLALKLRDSISERYGYDLAINDDSAPKSDCEILIGNTKRDVSTFLSEEISSDKYYYAGAENILLLTGNTDEYCYESVNTFIENYICSDAENKTLNIDIEGTLSFTGTSKLKVMSFNIYNGNQNILRMEAVLAVIRKYDPDVLMTQETRDWWVVYLMQNLGKDYNWAYTVSNRHDSDETNQAIFYKPDKLSLIERGMFWPSYTPDVKSKFTNSYCYRIITYAVLEVISSGKRFMCVDVHLDQHDSDLQASVLIDFLKKYEDLPVIIAGDFNSSKNSATYLKITSYNRLENAADEADILNDGPTIGTSNVIDYCFVTPETIDIHKFSVIIYKYLSDMCPSDHNPLLVSFSIK